MLYDLNSTPPGLPTQTVATAARVTNMSEVTIRRRIKGGTLPAYRVGRSIRINSADLFHLYEPVNMAPTESQERIDKLAKARKNQEAFRAVRRVDEPDGTGALPNGDKAARDRVGDEVVARIDPPVDRLLQTGMTLVEDTLGGGAHV